MAKSLRSKTKRDYRSKKREDGIYAATEAARLHRLNAKLLAVAKGVQEDDSMPQDEEDEDADQLAPEAAQPTESGDAMTLDEPAPAKKISTHGPRNSRREQWRASKGLDPKPKRDGVNRQGVLAGRRKAGRSKRRR